MNLEEYRQSLLELVQEEFQKVAFINRSQYKLNHPVTKVTVDGNFSANVGQKLVGYISTPSRTQLSNIPAHFPNGYRQLGKLMGLIDTGKLMEKNKGKYGFTFYENGFSQKNFDPLKLYSGNSDIVIEYMALCKGILSATSTMKYFLLKWKEENLLYQITVPDNEMQLFQTIRAYLLAENDEARAAFRSCYTQLVVQAKTQCMNGNYQKAIDLIQKIFEYTQSNTENGYCKPMSLLVVTYLLMDDFDSAMKIVDTVSACQADEYQWNPEEWKSIISEKRTAYYQAMNQHYYSQAVEYAQSGAISEALEAIKNALAIISSVENWKLYADLILENANESNGFFADDLSRLTMEEDATPEQKQVQHMEEERIHQIVQEYEAYLEFINRKTLMETYYISLGELLQAEIEKALLVNQEDFHPEYSENITVDNDIRSRFASALSKETYRTDVRKSDISPKNFPNSYYCLGDLVGFIRTGFYGYKYGIAFFEQGLSRREMFEDDKMLSYARITLSNVQETADASLAFSWIKNKIHGTINANDVTYRSIKTVQSILLNNSPEAKSLYYKNYQVLLEKIRTAYQDEDYEEAVNLANELFSYTQINTLNGYMKPIPLLILLYLSDEEFDSALSLTENLETVAYASGTNVYSWKVSEWKKLIAEKREEYYQAFDEECCMEAKEYCEDGEIFEAMDSLEEGIEEGCEYHFMVNSWQLYVGLVLENANESNDFCHEHLKNLVNIAFSSKHEQITNEEKEKIQQMWDTYLYQTALKYQKYHDKNKILKALNLLSKGLKSCFVPESWQLYIRLVLENGNESNAFYHKHLEILRNKALSSKCEQITEEEKEKIQEMWTTYLAYKKKMQIEIPERIRTNDIDFIKQMGDITAEFVDDYGMNALMYAGFYQKKEIFDYLCTTSISRSQKNILGMSLLDLCILGTKYKGRRAYLDFVNGLDSWYSNRYQEYQEMIAQAEKDEKSAERAEKIADFAGRFMDKASENAVRKGTATAQQLEAATRFSASASSASGNAASRKFDAQNIIDNAMNWYEEEAESHWGEHLERAWSIIEKFICEGEYDVPAVENQPQAPDFSHEELIPENSPLQSYQQEYHDLFEREKKLFVEKYVSERCSELTPQGEFETTLQYQQRKKEHEEKINQLTLEAQNQFEIVGMEIVRKQYLDDVENAHEKLNKEYQQQLETFKKSIEDAQRHNQGVRFAQDALKFFVSFATKKAVLGKYNPDEQYFDMKWQGFFGSVEHIQFKIPMEVAPQFKESFGQSGVSFVVDDVEFADDRVHYQIDCHVEFQGKNCPFIIQGEVPVEFCPSLKNEHENLPAEVPEEKETDSTIEELPPLSKNDILQAIQKNDITFLKENMDSVLQFVDDDGMNALMYAALYQNKKIIDLFYDEDELRQQRNILALDYIDLLEIQGIFLEDAEGCYYSLEDIVAGLSGIDEDFVDALETYIDSENWQECYSIFVRFRAKGILARYINMKSSDVIESSAIAKCKQAHIDAWMAEHCEPKDEFETMAQFEERKQLALQQAEEEFSDETIIALLNETSQNNAVRIDLAKRLAETIYRNCPKTATLGSYNADEQVFSLSWQGIWGNDEVSLFIPLTMARDFKSECKGEVEFSVQSVDIVEGTLHCIVDFRNESYPFTLHQKGMQWNFEEWFSEIENCIAETSNDNMLFSIGLLYKKLLEDAVNDDSFTEEEQEFLAEYLKS